MRLYGIHIVYKRRIVFLVVTKYFPWKKKQNVFFEKQNVFLERNTKMCSVVNNQHSCLEESTPFFAFRCGFFHRRWIYCFNCFHCTWGSLSFNEIRRLLSWNFYPLDYFFWHHCMLPYTNAWFFLFIFLLSMIQAITAFSKWTISNWALVYTTDKKKFTKKGLDEYDECLIFNLRVPCFQ